MAIDFSPLFHHSLSVIDMTRLFVSRRPPSIIVGVSGTDSTLAALLCARAIENADLDCRLHLVHFGSPFPPEGRSENDVRRILGTSPSYRWVPRVLMPWLAEKLPSALVETRAPPPPGDDHARWAELFRISIEDGGWVAAPINWTEKLLGNYSSLAKAASVWPIAHIAKSDVLEICRELGVPQIALDNARQADCDCGRDDLAASHIREIDLILEYALGSVAEDKIRSSVAATVLPDLSKYVSDCLTKQGFKAETPYTSLPQDDADAWRMDAIAKLERIVRE